jgi:hypothetical protein
MIHGWTERRRERKKEKKKEEVIDENKVGRNKYINDNTAKILHE